MGELTPVLAHAYPARRLAERLGLECSGDCDVDMVAGADAAAKDTLVFSSGPWVGAAAGACVVASSEPPGAAAWIRSEHPRLDFARALRLLAAEPGFLLRAPGVVSRDAVVSELASLSSSVHVGEGSRVDAFARVAGGVRIGRNCWVKSGAVVGEDGFGFERGPRGHVVRMIHFGGVAVGDGSEVGALATVCGGTLGPTVLEDGVMVDDHVHVAHNVRLRKNSSAAAHAEISGSVDVGEGAWIGPGARIRDHVKIGARSIVGVGAVVVRDVPDGATVAGCPARPLEPRLVPA